MRRATLVLVTLVLGACAATVTLPRGVQAQPAPGYGTGVFAVDGTSSANFSLADGGTYFLSVATDTATDTVDARIAYNGTLEAEVNGSTAAASLVSLSAGEYTMELTGHGRAALGWDFTRAALQTFPDNRSVSAFLRPGTAHLNVAVSLGDALEVHVAVYDDRLLPVTAANVTASQNLSLDLPAGHATSALISASVVSGNPNGLFGLSWWSPAPGPPGPDLGSAALAVVLWIGVPVVIAVLAFALLRRRGRLR